MSVTSTGPRSAPTLKPGDLVGGKYRVMRLIGQGGMGAVYVATHATLGSDFALKVLSRSSELFHARFLREGRILATLRSEHVAKVVDFGVIEEFGVPYMVMEYLPGLDLSAHLDASAAPLPVRDAVDHVLEACEALAEAHRAGIVHRDVKPSNLFLTTRFDGSPTVKVLDFGIAKHDDVAEGEQALTATEMVFGSPAYMSPEQVRSSKQVGPPTDVWSMALVLYELVSKRHPFLGDTPAGIVAAIAADPPIPLASEIGPHLWQVLEPALRKDPRERTQTIAAFAAALVHFGSERGRIVLSRIERLAAASSAPGLHETRAMVSSNPSYPDMVLPRSSNPPLVVRAGALPASPLIGSVPPRAAYPSRDEPPPASARTTYGPQSRLATVKRSSIVGLAVGGVLIVAIGAWLGVRSQLQPPDRGTASAMPPPPTSALVVAPAASSWLPSPEPSIAVPLPSSDPRPSPESPASRGGASPGKKNPKSAGASGTKATTPPRQGEFN